MPIKMEEYSAQLDPAGANKQTNLSFKEKTETREKCPDSEGGYETAFLQIKYFYSNFCPWCKREEPILQRMVKNYGNLVYIGWYNINACPELVNKYKVSGVPTFVFSTADNQTEYSHYGFIYEKDLMKLMCDVTRGC